MSLELLQQNRKESGAENPQELSFHSATKAPQTRGCGAEENVEDITKIVNLRENSQFVIKVLQKYQLKLM